MPGSASRFQVAPELIPADGTVVAAPAFALLQLVGGLVLLAGPALLGVALMRTAGVPRRIGAAAPAGALLLFVPLPEAPVLSGLHVELLRGIAVTGLGLVMIRGVRSGTPEAFRDATPRGPRNAAS